MIDIIFNNGNRMAQHESGIYAKIICDSISEKGHRLVTMECKMHRFALAELNTHRALSKNSASSRAIPINKMINRVMTDPAVPVWWGKNQAGMQAKEELTGRALYRAKNYWAIARSRAIDSAQNLLDTDLHKQLVNRRLEADMWHTVIISATEWDNFFWQRCHEDALPEFKALADCIQMVYYSNTPNPIENDDWHLPYISNGDQVEALQFLGDMNEENSTEEIMNALLTDIIKRISVARCARVSYLGQDGKRDLAVDINLFEKLSTGMHWSPFEHVARPSGIFDRVMSGSNFVGWHQYRKDFANENRKRFIPNLPQLAHIKERMEKENASK